MSLANPFLKAHPRAGQWEGNSALFQAGLGLNQGTQMFLKALIFYLLGCSAWYVTETSVFGTAVDILHPSLARFLSVTPYIS